MIYSTYATLSQLSHANPLIPPSRYTSAVRAQVCQAPVVLVVPPWQESRSDSTYLWSLTYHVYVYHNTW